MLSKSQIDKIGKRLKEVAIDADCLRSLELFRAGYLKSYAHVENVLVDRLRYVITGRPSKSTVAIVDKLRRETIRLSQIQDIAGCRVLVPNVPSQDSVVEDIRIMLPDVAMDDKRDAPTNGYRAVHVIVKHEGRPVEVQIRTNLQHFWAELSEKLADKYGHSIKYGEGDDRIVSRLNELSGVIREIEGVWSEMSGFGSRASMRRLKPEFFSQRQKLTQKSSALMRRVASLLREMEN